MKEPKKMNFEEGKNYLIDTIIEVKDLFRPVLISVHGNPDAGKTYLTNTIINEIYQKYKLLGFSFQCRDCLEEYIKRDPVFLLMEDLPGRFRALEHFIKYFERGPTLSVLLTRQPLKTYSKFELKKVYRENYDAVIENIKAREKNSHKGFEARIAEQ
ncbi:MAG: hypothetical protein QW404_02240 [Candidatus Nanoarchaeia archaeon]